MALCPPSKGSFEGVTEGPHVAVCSKIVDLGVQDGPFGNKHQVLVEFEVPDERVKFVNDEGAEIEAPKTIGKFYTFSLAEKSTLRKDLESWRGKAFTDDDLMDSGGNPNWDISKLLGVPCQLSVIKNDTGRAVIGTVMGLPKGFPAPTLEGDGIIYDADNLGSLSKLSQGLQGIIGRQIKELKSDSFAHVNQQVPLTVNTPPPGVGDDYDDDIPF